MANIIANAPAPSLRDGPVPEKPPERRFPCRHTYGAVDLGTNNCRLLIAKPVDGTVQIAADGVELSASAFAVDPATGLATLATAPGAGVAMTAGFGFDTPVRFDADRIEVTLESFDAGRMAAVLLIEVRV